ncbi:hypothetical protein ACTWP5_26070 [Streptomyces sp. 4N509B]
MQTGLVIRAQAEGGSKPASKQAPGTRNQNRAEDKQDEEEQQRKQ